MTGTLASTLGIDNPFRYRGYYYDTESGLYYLQSRYYDPEVGRVLNADVFASTGQGILGCNQYAYCLNNPVALSDPSGGAAYSTKLTDGGGSGKRIQTELSMPKREPANKWIRARNMIKSADVTEEVQTFLYTALDAAITHRKEKYDFDNWNCSQFVNEILWAWGIPKSGAGSIHGGTNHQREYAYGRGLKKGETGLGWTHSSDMSLVQPGDLLYWNLDAKGIGHVAVYLGEGWIIDNAGGFDSGVRLLPLDSDLDEWVRPQR